LLWENLECNIHCFLGATSKCEDKKISKSANRVKDVFHKNKIFFSDEACNNVNSSYYDIGKSLIFLIEEKSLTDSYLQ